MLEGLELLVANTGDKPTFTRGSSESWIDITAAKGTELIKNWQVMDRVTLSDHWAISFSVVQDNELERGRTLRWDPRKISIQRLTEKMNNKRARETTAEARAKKITRTLQEAGEYSMPRRPPTKRKGVYWWNTEIANARREALAGRRAVTRARRRGEVSQQIIRRKKESDDKLRKAIDKSKKAKWKELCDEVEADPWGKPYRIVMGKLKKRGMDPEAAVEGGSRAVIEALFPQGETEEPEATLVLDREGPLTQEEIAAAVNRLPTKKAPGTDGLPNELIKEAFRINGEIFADAFNKAIEEGVIPKVWKTARVVLIPKPGKDSKSPTAYRPVCLLNGLAKVFERAIANRIEKWMETRGGFHPNQYGFRRNKSTTDAIIRVRELAKGANTGPLRKREHAVMVALDIKNAFNTLPWHVVRKAAEKRLPKSLSGLVSSYLKDRAIIYNAAGEEVEKTSTRGVPQGSVLGPLLWNLVYDGVLEVELPEGATAIAFADDLAMVVRSRNMDDLKQITEEATGRILSWMRRTGLEVAAGKTQAVWLSTKRSGRQRVEQLRVGSEAIQIGRTLKYLGVWLEANPRLSVHCLEATESARKAESAVARILPNPGGAGEGRRRLLATVARAKLAYAAPVWAQAMEVGRNAKRARRALRISALRIIRGYRTISTEAAEVLASQLPGDLYVTMRGEQYREAKETGRKAEASKAARERALDRWQERWSRAQGWTRTLISNIKQWVGREHGEMSFELTQLLTGHGSFEAFRRKIGKDSDGICRYCMAASDTAHHTLTECQRWEGERAQMAGVTGTSDAGLLITRMLEREESWAAVERFAHTVMRKKYNDELERR